MVGVALLEAVYVTIAIHMGRDVLTAFVLRVVFHRRQIRTPIGHSWTW